MNYAIIITYLRIALIPIMVLLFFLSPDSPRYSLTFIFFLAAITDYLDGFIARKKIKVRLYRGLSELKKNKSTMIGIRAILK